MAGEHQIDVHLARGGERVEVLNERLRPLAEPPRGRVINGLDEMWPSR